MVVQLNDFVYPPTTYRKYNPFRFIALRTIRRFTIRNQDYIFAFLSLILIFLEFLIVPLEFIFGVERLGFYVLFTIYFMYLLQYFLKPIEGRTEMELFGSKISFTSSENKLRIAQFGSLSLLLSTVLYAFGTGSLDFIDFHQYMIIFGIYGAVLVKFFSINDELTKRYPDLRIKRYMYLNYLLLFVIPLYLTSKNNFAFENQINLVQNQLLLIIAVLTLVGCAGEDIANYWKADFRNLLKSLIVAGIYLIIEFNILTQTSGRNMFQSLEIIIFQASTLILISSGLTLTTRVRKFGNFAHAEFVAIGLYVAINLRTTVMLQRLIFYEQTGIFGVLVLAFVFTGICGILGEVLVFAPLDRRDADPLTLMVASIGMGLVIRQAIQEYFGGGDQGAIDPQYPLWLKDLREPLINNFPLIEVLFFIGLGWGIYYAIKNVEGSLIAKMKAFIKSIKDISATAKAKGWLHSLMASLSKFMLALWLFIKRTIVALLWGLLGWSIGHFIGLLIPEFRPNDRINPGDSISDWSASTTSLKIGYFELSALNIRIRLFNPGNLDTVIVSADHAWAFLIMIIAVFVLRIIFTKTILGISMRATADDVDLSLITGINTRMVIYWTWFIAAGLTGLGALYHFEASNVIPAAGFRALLIIFAVVILGGFDSFEGTLISAFIVSTVKFVAVSWNSEFESWQTESSEIDKLVFWNPESDWTNVIPFAIIIVVLLIRPRGIFGVVDPRSKL